MTYFVQRTCTVINEGETEERSQGSSVPLTNLRNTSAYVLIGEPGAGKMTSFKCEAASHGGAYVTARNFLTFDDKPEWHGTTLYIDGLDETRAGLTDGRPPLDLIRRKLHRLGCPQFRLSCRWADWLGSNDRDRLKDVSADGRVTVLRLDPLSKRNIKDILSKNFDIEDTDRFIAAARDRGVDALLKNPQTLEMLAEAVSAGRWPESRKETFELACRKLIAEPNPDHLIGNPNSGNITQLMNAAGRLCAVQLLSGGAGYTLPGRAVPDGDYPALEEIHCEEESYARSVLGTRLFVGASEGCVSPVHRQISEFLAARYVAGLIDKGLPLERVLALMAGFDGDVMPKFRVFSVWLAVHSKTSRKRISEINPSGMIYIGDARNYSVDEKRDILKNLRRESNWNPWCSRSIRRLPGIGEIVTPELEETFREILSDSDREHAHQSYVMMLLGILADGEALPGLSDLMQQIVRDNTWNQGVRCAALDVLVKQNEQDHLDASILKRILGDIKAELICDLEDGLLGIILQALYPKTLSVAEVLQFLRRPKNTSSMGEYSQFWTSHVPKNSTCTQLGELLDAIAVGFNEYRSFFVGEIGLYTLLGQLPIILLSRILDMSPGNVPVERLFNWLLIASDPKLRAPKSQFYGVQFWLHREKEVLKKLIVHGVNACSGSEDFWECMRLVERRLFGARPWDFATWCLDQALTASDRNATRYYTARVAECLSSGQGAARLTGEIVRERIAGDADLLTFFDQKMSDLESPALPATQARRYEAMEDTQGQHAWQRQIELQESDIRENRGDPFLLATVAMVYLGNAQNVDGNTPEERLHNLIGSQGRLISVVLEGIRGAINRNDLPDCSEIVNLGNRNRTHLLALPFMAGLAEIEQTGQFDVNRLSENQIRLAVTILYTLPIGYLYPDYAARTVLHRPKWFRSVLTHCPALVADVLTQCVRSKLRNGERPVPELYELATSDDHKEIARLAALPLLEGFPAVRTTARREALSWLLKAALLNCDWSQVIEIITSKLSDGDADTAQRVYWLAAGFVVAPERYREELKAQVSENEPGQRALVEFVCAGRFPSVLMQQFNVGDLKLLIDLMASASRDNGLMGDAWRIISNLIEKLSSVQSSEATESLEALSSNANLEPWFPTIAAAVHRQIGKRREVEFRHGDIQEVVNVLDNRSPANAADLAALVVSVIEDFSMRIRDGNTSDWRQYWNVDSHNRPQQPRPENACRDALLSDLRSRVEQLDIDAQREGSYAEDKRADIRVSFGSFNVPVEIKKSCHSDLWTAIQDQLIAKYSRDPGTEGYGVYLVFWFGDTEKCRPTPGPNLTPQNGTELKSGLMDTLSASERRKISVCVIDVSKPQQCSNDARR